MREVQRKRPRQP